MVTKPQHTQILATPQAISAVVALEDIRLSRIHACGDVSKASANSQLVIATKADASYSEEHHLLSVSPSFRIREVGADTDSTSTSGAVNVECTFELAYRLPEDTAPAEEAMKAFANTNAVFNAWPYWRECVQSMFSRMGLPQIVIPLYRLKSREPATPAATKTPAKRRSRKRTSK